MQPQAAPNNAARWKGRPDVSLAKPSKLRATPSPLPIEEQNQLAGDHLPLARSIAREAARDHPSFADELESAAALALVEASRRYDPALGAFSAYAGFRIGLAIADVVRRSPRHCTLDPRLEPLATCPPIGSGVDDRDAVEHLLRNLPLRQAQVCEWAYRDGLSQVEIARRLGISRAEASRIHALALTALRVKGIAC